MNILKFLYLRINNRYFRKYIISKIYKIEGGQAYSTTVREIYEQQYRIKIGYGSYGGCFDLSNIPPNVEFGNYCSIAKHVRIFRANHPSNSFTTHPILYNPIMGYVDKDLLDRPSLKIGNCVWIGSDVIILPSVNFIANGAIIGAGSVVTKNVAPYSIIVGNPAKEIRKRFPDEIIHKLESTRWWELTRKELVNEIPRLNKIVNYEF